MESRFSLCSPGHPAFTNNSMSWTKLWASGDGTIKEPQVPGLSAVVCAERPVNTEDCRGWVERGPEWLPREGDT